MDELDYRAKRLAIWDDLLKAAESYAQLCMNYRLASRPSEKLLDELIKASEVLKEAKKL